MRRGGAKRPKQTRQKRALQIAAALTRRIEHLVEKLAEAGATFSAFDSPAALEAPAYLAMKKERDEHWRAFCASEAARVKAEAERDDLKQRLIVDGVELSKKFDSERKRGRNDVLEFIIATPMTGENVYERMVAVLKSFVEST